MTKKKPGAKRGRPRKDVHDQAIVDLAEALARVLPLQGYKLGPERLRNLALALIEARARQHTSDEREKLPPRFRRSGLSLVHELPATVSYKGREGAIAQKLRDGKIKARPDVVARIVDDLTRSWYIGRALEVLGHFLSPQKPK